MPPFSPIVKDYFSYGVPCFQMPFLLPVKLCKSAFFLKSGYIPINGGLLSSHNYIFYIWKKLTNFAWHSFAQNGISPKASMKMVPRKFFAAFLFCASNQFANADSVKYATVTMACTRKFLISAESRWNPLWFHPIHNW